jgi:hypothetical protein
MTTISAFVERPKRFSSARLIDVFDEYKRLYGGDIGLMLVAMNLELQERIISLEDRVVKLEGRRR